MDLRAEAWSNNERYSRSQGLLRDMSERTARYTMPDFPVVDSRAKQRTPNQDALTYVRDCAYRPDCPADLGRRAKMDVTGVPGGYARGPNPAGFKRPKSDMVRDMHDMSAERQRTVTGLDGPEPNMVPLCVANDGQCIKERRGVGVVPMSTRFDRYAPMV